MAGAPFALGAVLEALWQTTEQAYQDLVVLVDRSSEHVEGVLENIKAYSRNGQNGFAVPKTPVAPKTRPRISARRKASTNSTTGPRRTTRSVAKAAQKRSSIKSVEDAQSVASSEDPEKENAGVQPGASTRTTRKRGAPAVKVEPATPAENTPVRATRRRQPLQTQHQMQSQAKALAADATPCTPPTKRANVARGLLASPAARQTPPRAKQLFSPYAKCSVQEKAKAFESNKAITPAPASTAKKTTAAQRRAKAAGATSQAAAVPQTPELPLPPPPVTPAPPPPAPQPEASTSAAADVEVASSPPPSTAEKRERRVTRQTASEADRKRPLSSRPSASESTGQEPVAATREEENLAPCTPELAPSPEKKRVTRSCAAAQAAASCASEPIGQEAANCSVISSSPSSVVGSSSSDDEWMSPPTSPKRAKLVPQQQPRSAFGATKKDSGVPLVSVKALTKARPTPTVARKLSASYSFWSTNSCTPKHGATPSKLGRPVGTSEKRPGSVKHFGLDESKRHDRSSSEVEQQRKQEILRQKIDTVKRDREQKLARAQAERQRRDAQRVKNELQRQRQAEQKELERLKQRTAFHQRKQSERSLHVDVLGAASKRKAESPLVSASKKVTPLKPVKPPRMVRNACADAEAARLIFGQPSTSLSQKAKLNNSLQQQAMLNSLSQSLRSQTSFLPSPERSQAASAVHSVTELVEATQEKPATVLNTTVTISAADKSARPLDQTFTVPGVPSEPKTPTPANSTFVQNSGGPPKCNGYDITPHRSELPPEPNKEKDNYDINDLNSGDETDDDEKPRKQVPLWAKGAPLSKLAMQQAEGSIEGLVLFGGMPLLLLDKIFNEKKRYFNKRTSSALWD